MVTVYPTFEPTYHTYYLRGLLERFGRVRYSMRGFPWLHRLCLAFIADGIRVYIDARDPTDYDEMALEWCDVYGKMNLDWDAVPADRHNRFLPIGPSFSIRLWNLPMTALNALRNYLVGRERISRTNTRRFFAGYWQQHKAHDLYQSYIPQTSDNNYVFFASTLWPDQPVCNQFRANFVIACRELPWLRFEGGLVPRRAGVEIRPEWRAAMGQNLYPIAEYRPRVARSTLVFNTPAVHGCHGWKLGEYLALGKAVIATPPVRALPEPFIHGVHAHIVDGSVESLQEAITFICRNDDYRRKLEQGARAYFEAHLTPRRVIERLIAAGRQNRAGPVQHQPQDMEYLV